MALKERGKLLAAGLLAGALIGGGLAATTPAGAAVKNAASAAINWKTIWKTEIKPRADKRYYTKKASNARYYTKIQVNTTLAGYETKAAHDASLLGYYTKAQVDTALTNYYTKAQSDANYYTKTASDAKYAPIPGLIRGTFILVESNATFTSDDISFGYTLAAAPTVGIIPVGGPPTVACPGTLANPTATPGNLCIYLRYNSSDSFSTGNATLGSGASPFGAILLASRGASAYLEVSGSWAVRPSAAGLTTTFTGASGGGSSGPAINH